MALSGKYSGFMIPETKIKHFTNDHTYCFLVYYFTCFLEEITLLYPYFTHVSGDMGFLNSL